MACDFQVPNGRRGHSTTSAAASHLARTPSKLQDPMVPMATVGKHTSDLKRVARTTLSTLSSTTCRSTPVPQQAPGSVDSMGNHAVDGEEGQDEQGSSGRSKDEEDEKFNVKCKDDFG